jgi:hypothetical protein
MYECYQKGSVLSKTDGVEKVDENSAFRVGTISDLVTVYMLLITGGDSLFSLPVTHVVPELRGCVEWKGNEVENVKWENITLGALTGQLSGIEANCECS